MFACVMSGLDEARGASVGGVEVARPDAGDGCRRQAGVHRSGAFVGPLGVRGEPGEDRENEPEDASDREPARASQTRASSQRVTAADRIAPPRQETGGLLALTGLV